MRFAKLFFATVLVASMIGCRPLPQLIIGEHRFAVELATTPAERAKGLMFRESLPKNRGMLFVFEMQQPLSFWMQNTSIPLSIAYIDENGVIIDIIDMKPFDLTSIPSSQPARYALEVNQGEFRRKGIRPGNRIIFPEEVIKMKEKSAQ